MDGLIYTLLREAEWRLAQLQGEYRGSADDARDGFLHFSTAAQVRGSAAKHRAGMPDLWLLAVDPRPLGAALRWEKAASGSRTGLFPHLYASLPLTAVVEACAVPLDAAGRHVFPPAIP